MENRLKLNINIFRKISFEAIILFEKIYFKKATLNKNSEKS